jgi:chromate reductase, NAD(P)H dehydrogenase (quinone)
VEIVDLLQFNFPIFEERLSKTSDPTPKMKEFAEKIKSAGGVIIVTPEYNGGYPASLKNVVDLLYAEWKRKPIALAAVSDGQYGGSQVLTSLSFSLLKIGATIVPSMYRVANVQKEYKEDGTAANPDIQKFAKPFIDELLWYMEAAGKMEAS